MKLHPRSTVDSLRRLKSRRLRPESYLREMVKLADLNADDASAIAVDRVIELRGRIVALEQKVRELEARK